MAMSIKKPTKISNSKTIIVFDRIIKEAFNYQQVTVVYIQSFDELDVFLRNNDSQESEIIFIFDTLSNGASKLSDINKILIKNSIKPIDLSSMKNNDLIISASVFSLENSNSYESLIDALISQFHNDEVKVEYSNFYENLKKLGKKPRKGKEYSYKNVLPALYSDDFNEEVFISLVKKKYETLINTLCGA